MKTRLSIFRDSGNTQEVAPGLASTKNAVVATTFSWSLKTDPYLYGLFLALIEAVSLWRGREESIPAYRNQHHGEEGTYLRERKQLQFLLSAFPFFLRTT